MKSTAIINYILKACNESLNKKITVKVVMVLEIINIVWMLFHYLKSRTHQTLRFVQ